MAKVVFKQEAINDLSDIWEYTLENWSESQADRYYRSIQLTCYEIGENPYIGRNYSEISTNLFGFKTGKHVVFYHLSSGDEVEVIRILHERMDLKNKLTE